MPEAADSALPKPEINPPEKSAENRKIPEQKAETVKQAMGIFDEMAQATSRNKHSELSTLTEATSHTNGLLNAAQNARYSEPGAREMQLLADGKLRDVRRRLQMLSENNGQLGARNNTDRSLLEDVLIRTAVEQDPNIALDLANAVLAKFDSAVKETSDIKHESLAQRKITGQLVHENAQSAAVAARRVEDEIRRDTRDLTISQFARGSLQLDKIINDAVNSQYGQDKRLLDDNTIRSKVFKEKVRELIKEHLEKDDGSQVVTTPKQPPPPPDQKEQT